MKVVVLTNYKNEVSESLLRKIEKDCKVILICDKNDDTSYITNEFIAIDLQNFHDIQTCYENIIQKYKSIDYLININDGSNEGLFKNLHETDVIRAVEKKLLYTIFTSKIVLPIMEKTGSGTIINVKAMKNFNSNKNDPFEKLINESMSNFFRIPEGEIDKNKINITELIYKTQESITFKDETFKIMYTERITDIIKSIIFQKDGLHIKKLLVQQ